MSFEEQIYFIDSINNNDEFYHVRQRVAFVYEKFEKYVNFPKKSHQINFYKYFKKFDNDINLFHDFVHTTPLGDEKIAEHYFSYFVNHFLKT